MKKVLAMLLCAAMVASLCACGSANAPAETETAKETTAAATEAAAAAETEPAAENSNWKEEHPTWLCENKTEISVTTYDGVTDTQLAPSDDVYFWQWLENATNVHVNWDINPYSSYGEIISAKLAAAQDLSDVVVVTSGDSLDATLESLGSNGFIADMAPYWDTCFVNTKNYWENCDDIPYKDLVTTTNGNIWAVRNVTNAKQNRITALWNKAWLDKLGLKVPETLDEFYSTMKAFQEAGDLNGNGEADELCMTSPDMSYVMSYIGSAFNLHQYEGSTLSNFWENGDGVVIDERISEPMKNTLSYLNKLYEEGIFDPEVLTLDDDFDNATQKTTLGRYGCIVLYSSFANSYSKLLNKYYVENWDDSMANTVPGVVVGPVLASEYNGNQGICNKDQDLGFAAVVTEGENKEIAMKWLDFVYASKEALRERCYGPEGIGYEMVDGEPKPIYDADGNWINSSEYGCGQISLPAIQTFEQLMNGKAQWYVDQVRDFEEKADFYTLPVPSVTATEEEQEIIDIYKSDVKTYFVEMRNKFITGDADIETEWENYVSTIKGIGIEELLTAYQSIYDRTH